MKGLRQIIGTLLFVVVGSLLTAVAFSIGSVVAAIDKIPRNRPSIKT